MMKRIQIPLCVLFILTSCSSQVCPHWSNFKVDAPCLKSERWLFPSLPDYTGLSLEYTHYPYEDRFALLLGCGYFMEKEPIVTLHFPDGDYTFKGYLFEGGQKVSLPECVNTLLLERSPISIEVERYTLVF